MVSDTLIGAKLLDSHFLLKASMKLESKFELHGAASASKRGQKEGVTHNFSEMDKFYKLSFQTIMYCAK